MKRNRLFLGLATAVTTLAVSLTACKKEASTPVEDEVTSTSAILVETASVKGDAVYIVNTTPSGATRDSITAADVPASITTYLSTNYSGYTLKKAFKVSVSGAVDSYVIVIRYNDKPIGLKFDASGNFVKVFEQRERGDLKGKGWKQGGRFDGRDGKQRDTIALADLPLAIKTYFAANFAGDTLLHAFKGKDTSTVVISTNNGLYATAFSKTNTFVKRAAIVSKKGKKESLTADQLPAAITTYLTATYPGYEFSKAFVIKSNNTVVAYAVFINSNNTRYGIEFNASGVFVKNIAIR